MKKIFVPPIKIQGIKTKLVSLIAQNAIVNEHTIWVEPFMGSGVVGFNIAHKNAIFSDLNPHVIHFYKAIQDKKITPLLVREFLESEGEKLKTGDIDYYYEVRKRFNLYHDPLDFLFLNRSCFNGMIRFNKSGQFNVPYGHKPERFAKAYITKIVNQISYVSEKIANSNWKFLNKDFSEVIISAPDNAFIYCDPPYIGRHVDYFDSWDEHEERKLHDCLVRSGAKFMVSTWDYNQYRTNEYISTIWADCKKLNQDHYYFVGAKEENRAPMVEAILMNYNNNQIIHNKPRFVKEDESKKFGIQKELPWK